MILFEPGHVERVLISYASKLEILDIETRGIILSKQ